MNQRKAKKIRKLVYEGDDFRNRKYARVKTTGQYVNVGQSATVGKTEEQAAKKVAKRRIYKHFKQVLQHKNLNQLEKEIFNK